MEELFSLFVDYIDSIYYKGSAAQLAQEDPQRYAWEFKEFCWIQGVPEKGDTGDSDEGSCKIVRMYSEQENTHRRA